MVFKIKCQTRFLKGKACPNCMSEAFVLNNEGFFCANPKCGRIILSYKK